MQNFCVVLVNFQWQRFCVSPEIEFRDAKCRVMSSPCYKKPSELFNLLTVSEKQTVSTFSDSRFFHRQPFLHRPLSPPPIQLLIAAFGSIYSRQKHTKRNFTKLTETYTSRMEELFIHKIIFASPTQKRNNQDDDFLLLSFVFARFGVEMLS